MPSVVGTSVLDLRAAYIQMLGPEAVALAESQLPEPARRLLEELSPFSWVPIRAVMKPWIEALGKEGQQTADELFDEAVRLATRRTLTTVWRLMLRLTSVEAIVKRTSALHRRSRNVGELVATPMGEREVVVELTDYPEPTDRQVRSLAISMVTILELTGRSEVEATYTQRLDGARYSVRWGQR